ncbi:hypothetical protein [Cerasicoccus frondis]|uniref:hypothetical protein n=1 Tax=Cerasicoccus frondis TaxID=490090 RepID=UPI0028526734|nr:hypothetical protein [Cerasicoccus frondis]
MKRWLWVGGWGLCPEIQRQSFSERWPEYQHVVLYPGKLCITKLIELMDAANVERLGGYSLGAFLMLREQAKLPIVSTMLLAPILDLKLSALKGGRVDGRRLRVLLRWLRHDPVAAVNDFYEFAGLRMCVKSELPYQVDDLIWGIQQLAEPGLDIWRGGHLHACVGESDALLNGAQLQQLWPECLIIPDAGHDFRNLIKGLAA